ncbi:MAG: hypothetical protein P1S60_10880 [Anaerolineae bacterium]|nr:hypothetical protein [Anaerolineae bacterium]
MMYNADALWEMNKAHHDELLQVADKQRSLSKALKLPQKRQARALDYLGDILITAGSRIKARNTFVTHKLA